jgi:para-nitrobenzyl esterase
MSFEDFVQQNSKSLPPLIIGFTKEESIFFTVKHIGLMPLEQSFYESFIAQLSTQEQERLMAEYDSMQTDKSRGNFISDMVWKIPVLQLGALVGGQAPIWIYELSWTSRLMRKLGIGAFHGMDLFLQFNLVRNKWASGLLHLLHLNSTRRLGKVMQSYWANFAHIQNPNSDLLPEWPTYHPFRKQLLLLAHKVEIRTDAYKEKESNWEGIRPRTMLERLQHLEESKQAVIVKKEHTSSA